MLQDFFTGIFFNFEREVDSYKFFLTLSMKYLILKSIYHFDIIIKHFANRDLKCFIKLTLN